MKKEDTVTIEEGIKGRRDRKQGKERKEEGDVKEEEIKVGKDSCEDEGKIRKRKTVL